MDGLRVTYVWDLPAATATPDARYAKAPTALPGFAPPTNGEPLWIPETSVPGVLERLALTGLGLPSRRQEQVALSRTGLGRVGGQVAPLASRLDLGLARLAAVGLPDSDAQFLSLVRAWRQTSRDAP